MSKIKKKISKSENLCYVKKDMFIKVMEQYSRTIVYYKLRDIFSKSYKRWVIWIMLIL